MISKVERKQLTGYINLQYDAGTDPLVLQAISTTFDSDPWVTWVKFAGTLIVQRPLTVAPLGSSRKELARLKKKIRAVRQSTIKAAKEARTNKED